LPTMTGGRIRRALRYVDGDIFLATYGDGIGNIDIAKLVEFHKSQGCIATVTAVQPPPRFGRIKLADTEQVADGFSEKPQGSEGWMNGGFFVFNREIERYLDGDGCVLEQQPLALLARERQLAVYRHSGYWHCVDTLRDLEAVNQEWSQGDAPWKIW